MKNEPQSRRGAERKEQRGVAQGLSVVVVKHSRQRRPADCRASTALPGLFS
jgi:hypothetical protein